MNILRFFFCLITGLLFFTIARAQKITFYQQIAPIIHAHCTSCHRPGQNTPFSLITYDDVARRASFIKEVVSTGYMPPWKPDTAYQHYCHERVLSQQEINLIKKWVDEKSPEGEKNFEPEDVLKKFATGTLYNRKPDLTVMMQQPIHLKGDNTERFVYVKLPFEIKDTANVEAIEFIADSKRYIHHINYAFYAAVPGVDIHEGGEPVALNEDSIQKFKQFDPYIKGNTPMLHYGGWIPGTSYESFPGDIGFVLPRKGVILLTFHFAPCPVDTTITAGINIFFKKTPVKRKVQIINIGSGGIGQIEPPLVIFPNSIDSFKVKAKTGSDLSLLYVWPHMHLLGKSFKAYAVTPANDTIHLVNILHWDFSWQDLYKFKHLIYLPKGSVVIIEGKYDNTVNNPKNPNNPPKLVFSDESELMRTKDEMLTLIIIYVNYEPGDEKISLCKDSP